MDAFIEIFNAHRHWIMPGILIMLICLLIHEIRTFFAQDQEDSQAVIWNRQPVFEDVEPNVFHLIRPAVHKQQAARSARY